MLSNETAVGGDFLVHISSRFDDNVSSQAVTLQVMVCLCFVFFSYLIIQLKTSLNQPCMCTQADFGIFDNHSTTCTFGELC